MPALMHTVAQLKSYYLKLMQGVSAGTDADCRTLKSYYLTFSQNVSVSVVHTFLF